MSTTPKEYVFKKVELFLHSLSQPLPRPTGEKKRAREQREENTRQKNVRMFNEFLAEAKTVAPGVEQGSWPSPFLVHDESGLPVVFGTKEEVEAKGREILRLLSEARPAAPAAEPAAPAAENPAP